MEIELGKGSLATVIGWDRRHDSCPRIGELLADTEGLKGFRLVYRGDKKQPPFFDRLFAAGLSSRPQYHKGEKKKLKYDTKSVAGCRKLFCDVLDRYLKTPMAKTFPGDSRDACLALYDKSVDVDRYDMTQLLLDAMQYQNNQRAVGSFREYLFSLSASHKACIAAKFALTGSKSGQLVHDGYVFEYCPPDESRFLATIRQIRSRFKEFKLGDMYADRDDEVLIRFAMLPHFLLGFATLTLVSKSPLQYEAHYTPNPHFASGTATLKSPPDLEDVQSEILQNSLPRLAWVCFQAGGRVNLLQDGDQRDVSAPN